MPYYEVSAKEAVNVEAAFQVNIYNMETRENVVPQLARHDRPIGVILCTVPLPCPIHKVRTQFRDAVVQYT